VEKNVAETDSQKPEQTGNQEDVGTGGQKPEQTDDEEDVDPKTKNFKKSKNFWQQMD